MTGFLVRRGMVLVLAGIGAWAAASEGGAPDSRDAEVQALRQELERLKKRLDDLERKMPLPERTEEIKRGTEYVCPRGHLSGTPCAMCPVCGDPVSEETRFRKVFLDRRQSVSEMIESALAAGASKKVSVGIQATGIAQGTLGARDSDRVFSTGSVDVFLAAKPMNYSLFFLDIEGSGGNGPDEIFPTAQGVNGDRGSLQAADRTDRVRVREAWFRNNSLLDEKLSLVVGKLDMSNYFDRNAYANDENTQFVADPFANNPLLAAPGGPPDSAAGAAAAALYDTRRGWRFGFGAQSTRNDGAETSYQGYLVAEAGYQGKVFLNRPGNYRFWARQNGAEDKKPVACGLSFDQDVHDKVGLFLRAAREDNRNTEDPYAMSGGFEWRAPFGTSRVNDRLGLGYAYLNTGDRKADDLAEAYYSWALTNGLRLSPFLQWVDHAAGNASLPPQREFFIYGMRFSGSF